MNTSKPLNICFFGTPIFSVASLERLAGCEFVNIQAVITRKDAPAGRGRKTQMSPVKVKALELGLECLSPENVNEPEFIEKLKTYNTDIFVVIAYGQIFKPEVLEIPSIGPVNAHASLLPRYRGAAPIQASLLSGDTTTGVSTIFMNEKMDAGNIILELPLEIDPQETTGTLAPKLAQQSAQALEQTLRLLSEQPDFKGTPQDPEKATFTKKITTKMAQINWDSSAHTVVNLVRAMAPSPGAYTHINIKDKVQKLKIAAATTQAFDRKSNTPGTILQADKYGILVACKEPDLCVNMETIQLEGGKKLTAQQFLAGHKLEKGLKLFEA